MNNPVKNNYIQYVNRNGIVKAKNVVFENDGTDTKFTVSGIDEEFFIFSVYENNIQRFCVGIENLENTDMLGFINASMVDLSSIPNNAFLQSQTVVELSYNNEYVQNYKFGGASSGGGSSDDCDDLKFLKKLMSNLFPTHTFTYVPWQITYANYMAGNQPTLHSPDDNTCFYMRLNGVEGNFGILNRLLTHVNGAGDTCVWEDFKSWMKEPILFSEFETYEATQLVLGKGYKVVSNLPILVSKASVGF